MQRRAFILSLSASTMPGSAQAYPSQAYAPSTWPDIKAQTDRIILNWRASWSLTCQIKTDILTDLLTTNTAYKGLTFVDVDWDTFGQSQWARRLKVERRSTLIALKGDTEITRIVNEPFPHKLRSFLDTALTG